MRPKWILVLWIVLIAFSAEAAEQNLLQSDKDRQSYALGVDLARNLKRQGVEAEASLLAKGVQDELSGSTLLLSEEELHTVLNAFQTELKRRRAQPLRVAAIENKKEGETFLAENKTKEGVVTLPSGLQYKILKEGTGKKPTPGDTVEVNYRGMFINGVEFDSSYSRGEPVTFKVASAIRGWTEVLPLMPVGSAWELFVPPQLAYGERGLGRQIPPNATLIFDIELLAIK